MMEDHGTGSSRIKVEDTESRGLEGKASYKSWKKKYRKMRILFDQKMHDGEELHKQEQKGLETTKRIAIEIDRILDLLLEINDSPQIPLDKRIDISLDIPSDPDTPHLDIDEPDQPSHAGLAPTKSLKTLLKEVPHLDYSATADRFPDRVADLQLGHDNDAAHPQHPPSFLTADDIDNYIFEIDQKVASRARSRGASPKTLPTLAPLAHTNGYLGGANGHSQKDANSSSGATNNRDFAVRNPVSVYNWLRKHAPKTFLQDGESTAADKENGDDHHGSRGRKSVGGERGGGRGVGKQAERHSKRASVNQARLKRSSIDDSMDLDEDTGHEVSTPSMVNRGKRKRNLDEDSGYRPKGGSSRPTKKKRKSEGDSTPTTATHKRPRKSDVVASEIEADNKDD